MSPERARPRTTVRTHTTGPTHIADTALPSRPTEGVRTP